MCFWSCQIRGDLLNNNRKRIHGLNSEYTTYSLKAGIGLCSPSPTRGWHVILIDAYTVSAEQSCEFWRWEKWGHGKERPLLRWHSRARTQVEPEALCLSFLSRLVFVTCYGQQVLWVSVQVSRRLCISRKPLAMKPFNSVSRHLLISRGTHKAKRNLLPQPLSARIIPGCLRRQGRPHSPELPDCFLSVSFFVSQCCSFVCSLILQSLMTNHKWHLLNT